MTTTGKNDNEEQDKPYVNKEYPHLTKIGADRYSFLYHNPYVKNVVRAYMKANDISMRRIYKDTGIHFSDISRWLNSGSGNKSKRAMIRSLQDLHIMRIVEYLGFDLSIDINFKNNG